MDRKLKRVGDFPSEKIGDGIIIMNTKKNMTHQLNETSVFIWDLLDKGASQQEILDQFVEVYNVDSETARMDIDFIVRDMISKELIEYA